jgi:hypothetical protein
MISEYSTGKDVKRNGHDQIVALAKHGFAGTEK